MLHPVAGVVNLTAFRYGGAMRYLLLLFLAGCASSAPRQYAQGIPIAPSAPTFDPIFEAPTNTGHPGYVGPVENLPRSPHGRVLPETPDTRREPGLWAGDQPRGSGDHWKTMDPVAWSVRLPFLDEPLDPYQTTVHQQTVRRCAFIIGAVGIEQVTHIDLKTLSLDERQCFVARMFEYCTHANRTKVEFFETYGPPLHDAFRDMLRRTRVSAAAFERASCVKGDTETVRDAVANAMRAWSSFSGSINVVH